MPRGQVIRFANPAGLHKIGDASTARHIGLQNIDSLSFNQQAEIVQHVAILACRNVHDRGGALHHQMQSNAVVGADWLLEPCHA